LGVPSALATDQRDDLYVLNVGGLPGNRTVTVYGSGAWGDVAPIKTYFGIEIGDENLEDITVDSDGYLYLAHQVDDYAISVFAPDTTLVRRIQGPSTLLSVPNSVAVDAAGNLYVCNAGQSITVYPPGADGDASPSAILDVPSDAQGVRLDRHANVYVGAFADNEKGSIYEYSAGSTGSTAPGRTISGPHTRLNWPTSLMIEDPDVKFPPLPLPKAGG
jgi:sugar lactone lactonase YvrE